jgi:hypothetical protein
VSPPYQHAKLVTPFAEGNDGDDEPAESHDPLASHGAALDDADEDDETPIDVAIAFDPVLPDEDAPDSPTPGFVPVLIAPDPMDDSEEPETDVAVNEVLRTVFDDDDEGDDAWSDTGVFIPSARIESDDDTPFDGDTSLDLAPELRQEVLFAVDWEDSEAARQLVPVDRSFAALGRECRFHTLAGDIQSRCPLPSGFCRAAILPTRAGLVGSAEGSRIVCVANGRLLELGADGWCDAIDDVLADGVMDLVQAGEHVLLRSKDQRWYSFDDGTVRPAFGGRAVDTLCPGERWIGACRGDAGLEIVELEGEARWRCCPSPTDRVGRLWSGGNEIVVEDTHHRRWIVARDGVTTQLVGSERFRGGCVGERAGATKWWTTAEQGSSLVVVEVDLATGSQLVVARLPWTSTDDDVPTVFDMLWLGPSRRLIVASDAGVVALRLAQDPPSSELKPREAPVS